MPTPHTNSCGPHLCPPTPFTRLILPHTHSLLYTCAHYHGFLDAHYIWSTCPSWTPGWRVIPHLVCLPTYIVVHLPRIIFDSVIPHSRRRLGFVCPHYFWDVAVDLVLAPFTYPWFPTPPMLNCLHTRRNTHTTFPFTYIPSCHTHAPHLAATINTWIPTLHSHAAIYLPFTTHLT